MDIKAAARVPERASFVFKRLGGANKSNTNGVCKYWLAGRCNRSPCRFLHPQTGPSTPKQSHLAHNDDHYLHRTKWSRNNSNCQSSRNTLVGGVITQVKTPKLRESEVVESESKDSQQTRQKLINTEYTKSRHGSIQHMGRKLTTASGNKNNQQTLHSQQKLMTTKATESGNRNIQKTPRLPCKYWVTSNCVQGDKCENMHSWFIGDGFSKLATLEGHNKAVTGIALPSGSDKLYSGSKDKSVRVWDCNSGKCVSVVDLKAECGTLINEGPWVLVGLPHTSKAWNFQSQLEYNLEGSLAQVHAITGFSDLLFAGTEDGTILVWKSTSEIRSAELVASLKGHSHAVLSLVVGAKRLYSGSADRTIRVWDLESLKCMQTLNGHTDDVTAVLCWDNFLISGSLDRKLKVWAATESGDLETIFERIEDDGVITLCGVNDAEAKPILFSSCKDNVVRLYELPSFLERGRIFAKEEVRVVQIGMGGLFFTGDATGQISVWKLHGEPK